MTTISTTRNAIINNPITEPIITGFTPEGTCVVLFVVISGVGDIEGVLESVPVTPIVVVDVVVVVIVLGVVIAVIPK